MGTQSPSSRSALGDGHAHPDSLSPLGERAGVRGTLGQHRALAPGAPKAYKIEDEPPPDSGDGGAM